jgi:hypothetical protein
MERQGKGKYMSINRKEKRNKEVKAMEDECRAILDSSDKTFEEMNDEIVSLHRKNLRSIKYTGTPENIKEIESLVSIWDYSEVVCKKKSSDSIDYFSCLNLNTPTFSPFDYIKINDYVEEWYDSVDAENKILLLVIHTDNQEETL